MLCEGGPKEVEARGAGELDPAIGVEDSLESLALLERGAILIKFSKRGYQWL
jgi:hypothetical protein